MPRLLLATYLNPWCSEQETRRAASLPIGGYFCFGAGCFGDDAFEAVPVRRAGAFLAGVLAGLGKPVNVMVVILTGS